MHPILIEIGGVPIYSYGIFLLLAIILCFAIAGKLFIDAGYTIEQYTPIATAVFVGGAMGARLSHVIVEPSQVQDFLNFYAMMLPGSPGNILGMMLGGYALGYFIRVTMDLPAAGRFFAPSLAIMGVVIRIGCTMAGCCHGRETTLPWAIELHGALRHPTMIYELIFNAILAAIVWPLHTHITKGDTLVYFYFGAYTLFRFLIEYLRLFPVVAFGLTGIQLICIGVWIWLGLIFLWNRFIPQNIRFTPTDAINHV